MPDDLADRLAALADEFNKLAVAAAESDIRVTVDLNHLDNMNWRGGPAPRLNVVVMRVIARNR